MSQSASYCSVHAIEKEIGMAVSRALATPFFSFPGCWLQADDRVEALNEAGDPGLWSRSGFPRICGACQQLRYVPSSVALELSRRPIYRRLQRRRSRLPCTLGARRCGCLCTGCFQRLSGPARRCFSMTPKIKINRGERGEPAKHQEQ